jgi:hypothetical protein
MTDERDSTREGDPMTAPRVSGSKICAADRALSRADAAPGACSGVVRGDPGAPLEPGDAGACARAARIRRLRREDPTTYVLSEAPRPVAPAMLEPPRDPGDDGGLKPELDESLIRWR